jgi:hypothetical protein
MKPMFRVPRTLARRAKQRGMALFFALVCLVAIMLSAVMLVRSVDTSTLIAGNLAFQQAATVTGDSGSEAAIVWLAGVEAANATKNVLTDPTHPFNIDNAAAGYYSSLDMGKSLTSTSGSHFLWDNTDSAGLAAENGNTVRYVIQRMCRTSGVAVKDANCLFSSAAIINGQQNIPLPQNICSGPGCPVAGQTPQVRITSRITGPKNTLSYVQTFVY